MGVKNFRERSPVFIGIIGIIAVTAGTIGAFYIEKIPQVKQAYEIKAEFADAAGLIVENQVRVAGIKAGTVSSVELAGDKVLVTMEVENDIDIPDDAGAEIKLATLLGTKFVEIDGKGGGPYLEEGDLIPLERTAVPYEIFQAANEGTEVLEDLDGEALNDLLVELTKLTRITKEEVGTALAGLNDLGGQLNSREDDLKSLLAGSKDLTKLLSDEGDDLVRLIDASNGVLGSLASKREEIQSLLETTKLMAADFTDLLRDNRGNIDLILKRLHNALVVLDNNIEDLDVALEYAGPSSRYFGSIWQQGRWADIINCALIASDLCEQ